MIRSKTNLSDELFYNGAKPDQAAFMEFFESFLHIADDGLSILEADSGSNYVEFDNGILIGDVLDADGRLGMLRYNSITNSLQVYTGSLFEEVGTGSGGGGGFEQAPSGNPHLVFDGLNVGIGTGGIDPSFRFEINLGFQTNTVESDPGRQVLIGTSVISRGAGNMEDHACFGHQNLAYNNGYAIRHTQSGELILNSRGFDNTSGVVDNSQSEINFNLNDNQTVMVINSDATVQMIGNLEVGGDISENSDIRYKKNVLPLTDSLSKVLALRGVSYEKKTPHPLEKKDPGHVSFGLVAQEVEEVLPNLVETKNDGYKALSYTRLTPVLIEAIKELHAQNESLRERLSALEDRS